MSANWSFQHSQLLFLLLFWQVFPLLWCHEQVRVGLCQDKVPYPNKRPLWLCVLRQYQISQHIDKLWQLLWFPGNETFEDGIQALSVVVRPCCRGKVTIPGQYENVVLNLAGQFLEVRLVFRWPLGSCCGDSQIVFSSVVRLQDSAVAKHEVNEHVPSSRFNTHSVSQMACGVLFQVKRAQGMLRGWECSSHRARQGFLVI